MYGAELWGISNCKVIHQEENRFLRRLLTLPISAANYIDHKELGLQYLEDLIRVRPGLLWLSIWKNPESAITRDIILDCLSLDEGLQIPWISYVKTVYSHIRMESFCRDPSTCVSLSKRSMTEAFFQLEEPQWLRSLQTCPTVIRYLGLYNIDDITNYLWTAYSRWERSLLFRFRSGTVKYLLCFPLAYTQHLDSISCPCDDVSKQTMLHFIFFL